jgi:hypothetical protein
MTTMEPHEMTKSDRKQRDTPQDAVVIVAKDMVRSILEGETTIVNNLVRMAAENDIVLLKSCICEGLKESTGLKVEGLHAIGRLLSVSQIVSFSPEEDVQLQGMNHARITADALLSHLIGPLANTDNSKDLFGRLWLNGIVPMTRDVDLFAALACVRKGDDLHLGKFASTLTLLFVENADLLSPEEWFVSKEFIDELRVKAMAGNTSGISEDGWLSRTDEPAPANRQEYDGRARSDVVCPHCGKPLRTAQAKQCFSCHMDWHDPDNSVRHGGSTDGAAG